VTAAGDPVRAVDGPVAIGGGSERTKTVGELLSGYARTLAELRRRGVVRFEQRSRRPPNGWWRRRSTASWLTTSQ
jgi:hypothetical protein